MSKAIWILVALLLIGGVVCLACRTGQQTQEATEDFGNAATGAIDQAEKLRQDSLERQGR